MGLLWNTMIPECLTSSILDCRQGKENVNPTGNFLSLIFFFSMKSPRHSATWSKSWRKHKRAVRREEGDLAFQEKCEQFSAPYRKEHGYPSCPYPRHPVALHERPCWGLPLQGAQVQSLVGELRSCMPHGTAKVKRKAMLCVTGKEESLEKSLLHGPPRLRKPFKGFPQNWPLSGH